MASNEYSNVNPEEIYNILSEIDDIAAKIKKEIDDLGLGIHNIVEKAEKLNDFNDKRVAHSYKTETTNNVCVETWQIWKISHADEIISMVNSIEKALSDIDTPVSEIPSFITDSQTATEYIEKYINEMNKLSENFDSEQLQIQLDTIKDYTAEDEYSVMNGNYTGILPENEKYFTDDSLYARYDAATKTVMIYQIVDGKEVPMKWTRLDKWVEGIRAATGNTETTTSVSEETSKEIVDKIKESTVGSFIIGVVGDAITKSASELKSNPELTQASGAINVKFDTGGNVTHIDYDSSKNPYGKISEDIDNDTGVTTIEYDSDKSYDGIKSVSQNQKTGVITREFDSDKNSEGIKSSSQNQKTGVTTWEFDSDNNSEGRKSESQNQKTGVTTIEFDSDKNPDGRKSESHNQKTGVNTIEYDSDKSYDGRKSESYNQKTGDYTIYYDKNSDGLSLVEYDSSTRTKYATYDDRIELKTQNDDVIATMSTSDNIITVNNESELQAWKDAKTLENFNNISNNFNTNIINNDTDTLNYIPLNFPQDNDSIPNENVDITNALNNTFINILKSNTDNFEQQLFNMKNTSD